MKKIIVLLTIVTAGIAIIAPFSGAVTVTINHAGGTLSGTLDTSGLVVDSSGNITVKVIEDLTPGNPSPCTNNPPTVTVTNPPSSTTTGTQVSANLTYSDPDNDSVTVSSNYGSISGNTWTWTPQNAGTYTVTITANDGKTCKNTGSYSWALNVSSSGGITDPPGTVLLTDGVETTNYGIGAKGTLYFKVKHASICNTTSGQYRINLIESGAQITSNPDMVVKKSFNGTETWPTMDDYWRLLNQYGYNSGPKTDGKFFTNFGADYSGETVQVKKAYDIPGFNQADTYYILVYNNSNTGTYIRLKPVCY